MKMKQIAGIATVLALGTVPALAAEPIKIGFVTTLTTGAAVIGKDQQNAVNLAIEHMGAKMGGRDVKVIFGDDEFNPQKGKQKTEKLVKRDKVDIVAGYIWSHVLMASAKTVLDSGKILISANAGPSPLAGKRCNKNFFNISWQNDQTTMAMGEVLNQRGVKTLYVIAPNYAAGKNMVSGVSRTFKGKIVGKDMTKWPTQIDWAAEFTKVKSVHPDAVFAFYPGKHGGAFIKQYQQAGLAGRVPLYTAYTIDSIGLPKMQKAGLKGVLGTYMTQQWAPDMKNAQNQKFVADFKAKHGTYPSFYASQAYDSMFFIKAAVDAVGGKISNTDGMRAALEKADFPSVRGKLTMGKNHFPVQNFYLRKVEKDADGNWTTKLKNAVYTDHVDPYAKDCKM
jgi:branched-chain amino acid transport system substrate-binding protein